MVEYSDKVGGLVKIWNGGIGSTTSPVQSKVIPGLVGIGRGRSENAATSYRDLYPRQTSQSWKQQGRGWNAEGLQEVSEQQELEMLCKEGNRNLPAPRTTENIWC